MGIYQYTLRAGTKTVGDVEIAHFEYAYKRSWDYMPGQPAVARIEAAAHRAYAKLSDKGVRYFVPGKYEYAAGEVGLPVYLAPGSVPSQYCEEVSERHYKRAGTLYKRNGRFSFFNAGDALVGESCRDGAAVFYVTERDEAGNMAGTREFASRDEAARFAITEGHAGRYCEDIDNAARRRAHDEGVASGRIKVFAAK